MLLAGGRFFLCHLAGLQAELVIQARHLRMLLVARVRPGGGLVLSSWKSDPCYSRAELILADGMSSFVTRNTFCLLSMCSVLGTVPMLFFSVGLRFELRASHLQSQCSTA
jgi:hypothetical protein